MAKFDDRTESRVAELHRKEEEDLIRVLSGKYGHQYIDLKGLTIDIEALRVLDEAAAREAEIAPFAKTHKKLRVAIRNPNKQETKDVLEELDSRGYQVEIFMASTASLEHAWKRYEDVRAASASQKGVLDIEADTIKRLADEIGSTDDIAEAIATVRSAKSTREVSEILEIILGGALALKASDVHIEPEADAVRLRVRIDGVLVDVTDINTDIYELLRSRLKLLSGLKLNVTDVSQDGRFTIDIGEEELEIRSSVIPGGYGESIVMRVLDPSTLGLEMEQLGINAALFAVIEEEIARPNGLILTTGPTGSGKTTSLYAFLKRMYRPEIKIVTLEDPIEYHLDGIVQTQINDEYTFASGMRAVLRQDPDVIMVGEIRDRDVAETAINAALTGHLVFSTLHTNSAVGAFPRLIDLGVDSRLMGSAINLVLAQRLVRKLCEKCKTSRPATEAELAIINRFSSDTKEQVAVFEPAGCNACNESGYAGRIGIYEGIRMDSTVESAIIENPREEHILEAAAPQRIPNMQEDGIEKVLTGLTSLAELQRVIDLAETTHAAHEGPHEGPHEEA